jgi:hypothetical protein
LGVTCSDELRLILILLAMLWALSPSWVARAIDLGHERGGVDFLLKMCVDYARDDIHAPPELLGHAQVRRPVVADGPNVDL